MPDDPFGDAFGPLGPLVGRILGDLGSMDLGGALGDLRPPPGSRGTRGLDRFGRDLTADARAGLLDPVIGRDDEIDQVLEVLARRTKNNPVLLGDPGVGKTAIVEGIAQRIADGAVPAALREVRLVAIDLAGMVAGTKYRGEFEERLTNLIREIATAGSSLVVFVDELHQVVGAGSAEGAPMDAGTILKPALARGELRLIGATTMEEYRRHIEEGRRAGAPVRAGHGARAVRRADPWRSCVVCGRATSSTTASRSPTPRCRRPPSCPTATSATASCPTRPSTSSTAPPRVRACGHPTARRPGRSRSSRGPATSPSTPRTTSAPWCSPGSWSGSRAPRRWTRSRRSPRTTSRRSWPGAPASRSPSSAPSSATACCASRSSSTGASWGRTRPSRPSPTRCAAGRAGLGHPGRPVGSFLFLGPTGVGKTELGRALAEALFGSPDKLVRLDLSEYSDRSAVTRMIGAPPGHVGYDDAGQLTEAVRRDPYTVLLLDELEKAHPDVAALLLQVLDSGRLTDAHGRVVDFRHAIVIMTSNVGAERILAAEDIDDVHDAVLTEARSRLRPELVGRVDEVVLFSRLTRDELRRIVSLLLDETRDRLRARGVDLVLDEAAVDLLAGRGPRPELGARPLRRTIGREVERRLARMLLAGDVVSGQRVRITVEDGELALQVE